MHYNIIFKVQSRSSQPAIGHRLYGESNAIAAERRHTGGWEVTGNKNSDRRIHLHPCMLLQWADRQGFPMQWWSPHPRGVQEMAGSGTPCSGLGVKVMKGPKVGAADLGGLFHP